MDCGTLENDQAWLEQRTTPRIPRSLASQYRTCVPKGSLYDDSADDAKETSFLILIFEADPQKVRLTTMAFRCVMAPCRHLCILLSTSFLQSHSITAGSSNLGSRRLLSFAWFLKHLLVLSLLWAKMNTQGQSWSGPHINTLLFYSPRPLREYIAFTKISEVLLTFYVDAKCIQEQVYSS